MTETPMAPTWIDDSCLECWSEGFDVDASGTLVAGKACEEAEFYSPCRCGERATAWEKTGPTWTRTFLEEAPADPDAERSHGTAAAIVMGTPMVAGRLAGSVKRGAVWRKREGVWLAREDLPLGTGAANSGVTNMNGMGIVIGYRTPSGASAIATSWYCDPDPAVGCSEPSDLPSGALVQVGWLPKVSEAGDVAGWGKKTSTGPDIAVHWRLQGWDSSLPPRPIWTAPDLTLPGLSPSSKQTHAQTSAVVGGVLTVIGFSDDGTRRGLAERVRWKWTGTQWSAPVLLKNIDAASDNSPSVGGPFAAIGANGQVSSSCSNGSGCVEVPIP